MMDLQARGWRRETSVAVAPRVRLGRQGCGYYAVVCLLAVAPASAGSDGLLPALVDQYCVACHNQSNATAEVALDAADAAAPGKTPEVWEKALWKLRHRQMPPVGLPRPSEEVYRAAVDSLTADLDRSAEADPDPGRTQTFRRLTRVEYYNAIRDLLALDIDVADLLPRDESSHGFDNVTVGELSPTLLERYLGAARKISRLAVGGRPPAPTGHTILLPTDLTQEGRFDELPFGSRGGAVATHNFPVTGEYEVRLRLSRDRNERVEGLDGEHRVELLLDGRFTEQFTVTQRPRGKDHADVDRHLVARLRVEGGPHDIAATFRQKTAALLETERRPYTARFNMDRHPRTQPALYSITITGPFEQDGPGDTPSRRAIFVCRPEQPSDQANCAELILSNLMRRAYRRPIERGELETPLAIYEAARRKDGFDAGIEMAVRALLVNPQFLFRIERDPHGAQKGDIYRISDLELASRLSFFLWSSIPDDELLALAERGKLRAPGVLKSQVRRLLEDERADALVENFASQWLHLRNLDAVSPDPRLFPDFDENLRRGFERQTELFCESVLREDRSALDLLRSSYTHLNERLAKHYGIPGVYGSRFRRVDLAGPSIRGGLLGHGSILAVTSYANRTSPVVRGYWVLANILGTPPPPPPPGVPPLKEKQETGKVLSMRERIAEHRDNPACSTCHNIMDPVGFALENFDAIGRWRSTDGATALDVSGTLPDGSEFEDVEGFVDALLRRPDLFVSTLTEKLMTYALGRGVEYYDAPAIRGIVRDAEAESYRFSALVTGIVNSAPFQTRKAR